MMSSTDKIILNELDRKGITGDIISIIMNRLDSSKKKNQFIDFLQCNKNCILGFKEIFEEIKSY